jgi:hypothetical protein
MIAACALVGGAGWWYVTDLGDRLDASLCGEYNVSARRLLAGASLEETSASSTENQCDGRETDLNWGRSRSSGSMRPTGRLDQTVAAMAELHAQSGKISHIIKAIDEIAFQTNIIVCTN